MDSRTRRLLTSLDAYLEHPPKGAPDTLISQLKETQEMVSAPIFSEESPGEKDAREIAEKNMPPELYEQMYPDETGTDDAQVGVLQ
jgi:hypothetical protein